jgi:hypothetical protein
MRKNLGREQKKKHDGYAKMPAVSTFFKKLRKEQDIYNKPASKPKRVRTPRSIIFPDDITELPKVCECFYHEIADETCDMSLYLECSHNIDIIEYQSDQTSTECESPSELEDSASD